MARSQSASVGILPQPQRHVFAQDSGRDMFVIGVHDRGAEDAFRLEYALRVMAQSAMSKVNSFWRRTSYAEDSPRACPHR
jgi:hypothetical protein